jgi:hypothetical protein
MGDGLQFAAMFDIFAFVACFSAHMSLMPSVSTPEA